MNPIFIGNTKKGKLILQNEDKFNTYLRSLGEKEVAVIVRPWRKPRSLQQNKFLWAVPYQMLSEATGYTREEIHDSMRMLFLKDEDRDIPTLKSTTGLTTVEMTEYWAKMQQFAAEKLNLVIPDPKEVDLE